MFISKCIWVIENDIQDKEEINNFHHENGDIKSYETFSRVLNLKKNKLQ